MIQSLRRSLGGQVNRAYYSLLRTAVTHLVPEAIQFDDQDPILTANFTSAHRR
jgi:hypothetical protein